MGHEASPVLRRLYLPFTPPYKGGELRLLTWTPSFSVMYSLLKNAKSFYTFCYTGLTILRILFPNPNGNS